MKSPFDVAKRYLETPDRRSAEPSSVQTSDVSAVRGQRTEWHDLRIDDNTTGILICSTVLDADIWVALREDFEPAPDLPNLAVFFASEIPLLRNKSPETLRKIHEARLAFNGGKVIPPEEMI